MATTKPTTTAAPTSASSIQPRSLKVQKLPDDQLAYTNFVYLNPADFAAFAQFKNEVGTFVLVKDKVFSVEQHNGVAPGTIALNGIQRRVVYMGLDELAPVAPYRDPPERAFISRITLLVDYAFKGKSDDVEYTSEMFLPIVHKFFDNQFLGNGQKVVARNEAKVDFEFTVKSIEVADVDLLKGKAPKPNVSQDTKSLHAERGILQQMSIIRLEKGPGSTMKFMGGEDDIPPLFRSDYPFEQMGIGGLDDEFSTIFRRAFASRCFPAAMIKKLGLPHVKGILLFGPPGCGKTLMARQIAKMLNGKEPKIVNGPEVLSKFVGETEANVRKLFEDAEKEYKEKGDMSGLHVVIFDEIDAICKARGSRSDNTGTMDSLVNQLLSKIDGVDAINNLLLIGMTNRKDLLDEALLRPGRLEVQLEIGLPDEAGRQQILHIHLKKMRENKAIHDDVSVEELAKLTKNFTGAELAGLVRAATAYALQRKIDIDPAKGFKIKSTELPQVQWEDFTRALGEMKPAFAPVQDSDFDRYLKNGIIPYGASIGNILNLGTLAIETVRNSPRTPLFKLLLSGLPGSGKTAMAAQLAKKSLYPLVSFCSATELVGWSESGKISKVTKFFEDAYKSELSCLVIDDFEAIIEWVKLGARFSNPLLQTLLTFLRSEPPHGRKMLIIVTTNNQQLLEEMGMMHVFDDVIEVPQVKTKEEFKAVISAMELLPPQLVDKAAEVFSNVFPISVKKLITMIELARQPMPGQKKKPEEILSDFRQLYAKAISRED